MTLVADASGHAHLAFVPNEARVLAGPDDVVAALSSGTPLPPGDYWVVDHSSGGSPESGPHRVLGVDDHPEPSLYEQELPEGFGYLTVRDGVCLSVMVRFPNQDLYGPPPWPTVIEYSGYNPSDPDDPQPGTLIANLLGFAVVGVNMRGTGCSGGVFDVFSPAQAADGYDVVETVARQPWALHHKVGMVGLSYAGISQLYVAATRPPHLAAITPLSVIDDLYRQQWPGGIYNSGFTRAWIAMRDAETKAGGMAWDQARIDAGDETAAANQRIRSQNIDFEGGGRAINLFGPLSAPRRIGLRVHEIDVPVYMTGAWQDEQTGSHFASMLGTFSSSPDFRFIGFNGHHPDGYSPMVLGRWYEFLMFHVARRVPRLPELISGLRPQPVRRGLRLPGRARARPLRPPRGRLRGRPGRVPGRAPGPDPLRERRRERGGRRHLAPLRAVGAVTHPAGLVARRWWFDTGGRLADEAPAQGGIDAFADDPEAGEMAYAKELLSDLNRFTLPTTRIDHQWTRFADEHRVAYQTAPLAQAVLTAGAGHVELHLRPGSADTAVQVTVTEIRPDGLECRVQCGWHRPVHRREDPDRSDGLSVDYTFTAADVAPLPVGEWLAFRVPIYPFVHLFRPGSRIQVAVSSRAGTTPSGASTTRWPRGPSTGWGAAATTPRRWFSGCGPPTSTSPPTSPTPTPCGASPPGRRCRSATVGAPDGDRSIGRTASAGDVALLGVVMGDVADALVDGIGGRVGQVGVEHHVGGARRQCRPGGLRRHRRPEAVTPPGRRRVHRADAGHPVGRSTPPGHGHHLALFDPHLELPLRQPAAGHVGQLVGGVLRGGLVIEGHQPVGHQPGVGRGRPSARCPGPRRGVAGRRGGTCGWTP